MDKLAESGIAAHWMYKTGESSGQWVKSRASDWLHNLLEMQQGVGDSMEGGSGAAEVPSAPLRLVTR